MNRIYLLALLLTALEPAFSQDKVELLGRLQFDYDINNLWGYLAPDGAEYALVGGVEGVTIVSLADPAQPESLFIVDEGSPAVWRDLHTWGHYAVACTDKNNTTEGLLVFDLSDLPHSVTAFKWRPFFPEFGDSLNTCHNLFIDEFGLLYLSGCNVNEGGALIVDVGNLPDLEYIGPAEGVYSHDTYARDRVLYSSNIYAGRVSVIDLTDPLEPVLLATQSTPAQFAHNAWLSDDSKHLFTTDEKPNAPVAAYDISDLSDIRELDQFRPLATLGQGVTPHNVYVLDDYLLIAHYTDGLVVVDAARPDNLIEVGHYDTFQGQAAGFRGAWGIYPFFPSGHVLVSDITEGLFVFQIDFQRACYLEGQVFDASTGANLAGVEVRIDSDELNQEQTSLNGRYQTGLSVAGAYELTFSKVGYATERRTVELMHGQLTLLDLALSPLPQRAVSGQVVDQLTLAPVSGAPILLESEQISYTAVADEQGRFSFPAVYEGDYRVYAGSWGYRYKQDEVIVSAETQLELSLAPGYEDLFNLDLGWTVEGDAETGIWERGRPNGTYTGAGRISNPLTDSPTDAGNYCFVTGNQAGEAHEDQVRNGETILRSPLIDLSAYHYPILEYDLWLFMAWADGPPDDSLSVWIDDGEQKILLESVLQSESEWRGASSVPLFDHIAPGRSFQLLVIAGDLAESPNIVEGGFDHFLIREGWTEQDLTVSGECGGLRVFPNPTAGDLTVDYQIDRSFSEASLQWHQIDGKWMGETALSQTSGRTILPSGRFPGGLYLLSLQIDGRTCATLPVRRTSR